MSGLAEKIKATLTAQEVVEHYGFEVNRSGFAKCPFHSGDDTGSLKVYQGTRGWHCFGCGAGSSVIDFAMLLFGINAHDAMERLNADFKLGLTDMQIDPQEAERQRRVRQAAERERNAESERWLALSAEYARLILIKIHSLPESPDAISDEYAEACKRLDYIGYLLSETETQHYVKKHCKG
jgi:hypothetical protein